MYLLFSTITVVTLFLLGSMLLGLNAHGHASPISYIPKPNEVINLGNGNPPPNTVAITFTETPEPRASSINVVNSNNERIDNDDLKVSEADKSISISLDQAKLIPGIYTADWLVLSTDDGHITKGTYVFTVEGESNGLSNSPNQSDGLMQSPQLSGSQQSANDNTWGYSKNITTDEGIDLKFEINPYVTGQNTFNLSAFYTNGSAVENIRNVFLEFNNPSKDLGPIVDTMNKTSVGNYSSTGAFLSQTGSWEVKITVQRIGEYDINQEFDLDILDR
ncbi:copper resistance CopC family protein [Candidatus Nitrosocosmicus hydrocola]|uniref:copper resistance CopC family protein n=1 Tax=Candidatus Nitrosocosmicus hydrocola TaxID=1826872 RepID=UPI0011E5C5A4|nr:copper resistance protein CopC [Candidatus Nitrosocosmicus hydrocola]